MKVAMQAILGLGLFIYGMTLMGEGLQKAAGKKLKAIVGALTKSTLRGVLVGAFVTMLIQSSGATTVMVIGFVNAKIMTLTQAVGVIMGANIGTTATGFIIALNLGQYAPIVIGIGTIFYVVGKKRSAKSIGQAILGFGLIFLGIMTMEHGLKPLGTNPIFTKFMADLMGIPISIACTNGSLAFDEDDVEIYRKPLNGFQVETTLSLLEKESIYFHLYTMDGLITPYGEHPKASIQGRMPVGKEHLMKQVVRPMGKLKNLDETIYKIIIIENDHEKRLAFREKLRDAGISTSSSWYNNIEITDEQANKKEALQRILHRYSIAWDEVIAFGDNENDLPMLNAAGQAYLMGNASEELKKSVSFPVIGTNEEEGILHQLEELFGTC